MGEGWSFTGGPPNASAGADVTLVEGRSFCVSDRVGDLGGAATHGLIVQDTRFVEHLVLTVDGDRLEPLGVEPIGPHAATFVTRRKPRDGLADSTLLVVRERYVGNGLVEDITLENLSRQSEEHTLVLTVATDFANLFEVKEGRATTGRVVTSAADGAVISQATLQPSPRSVVVTGTGDPTTQGRRAQVARRHPSSRAHHHQRAHRALTRRHPPGQPLPGRREARRQRSDPPTCPLAGPEPAVALGRPQVRRAAANEYRRARGAAHHRSSQRGPRHPRRGSAVVHDRLRA